MKIDSTVKSKNKAGSNPTAIRKTVVELLRTKYANHTVRYSDGSLALGRVGIGISGPDLNTCYRLPDACNIFSAEAAAAYIAATHQSNHPIAVLTDSASVVAALESEKPMHPWIQQIFEDARPDAAFVWIPGHSGIPGNEKADQLAGSGRLMEFYTKRVPADDIKAWTTKMLKDRWAKEWYTTGQENSREYVLRKIKADTKKWEDPRGHRDQQVVSRLRTGHTAFAYNMGRGEFKRQCDICRVHQTVEHVLIHCPQYENPRTTYDIPGSIRGALGDDVTTMTKVIIFMKDIGLYNKI
ncbi:uncharacterized protein LOC129766209 [Toxorhynchites rutilus septentrionalis]|uniref:uncharacterized protein LOC129766209 n=1 Tax=Toxorhynchites rutilus septentrionalis TaxID=329112 RepID=UPI00247AA5AC|nr:uncharacterized protein LOC129766209 [Toxorhynchites rutilus septentrionalis]